ncbi:hypothetical protein [Chryseobacterium sp. BIGb0232]|uniref:hypothetical protein n=1 Tax=Chryseobacterium sp. BIGb0232 TaxID=2940598 RepID=UPI000F499A33|nr:hypothetical protein [Chryseobacterium sp. BIGb0232]MCS4301578.1 YHS domain-containing protein [Chryseobacterium sp. BIGb0232]ROS19567.1 hypothetical protein EDF65_0257 [Chryseobacterium nakagawai]
MKLMIRNTFLILFSAIALYACSKEKTKSPETATVQQPQPQPATSGKYVKGSHVPSETVCMVNNAYMGKKQIEVPHNGKMYYGCCEMCVKRIPSDKTAREAIDPYTGKTVDKADAYIVMISDEGEVAYFENEENYRKFLTQNS